LYVDLTLAEQAPLVNKISRKGFASKEERFFSVDCEVSADDEVGQLFSRHGGP